MQLSKFSLKNINAEEVEVPELSLFNLPEKVLQFGTGVLLRGLPDYFIDKANKQGIFNGRIVIVKSTDGGDANSFDKQDGLYSICVRGVEDGNKIEENIISNSISRVFSAKSQWHKILECAHNPEMQIIISNTTEVGIELVQDDIRSYPPVSYPGKLLSFLYERFKAFAGSVDAGLVIIPTELIVDNGKKLESIVMELAHLNSLESNFIDWLENANTFCSSLVDRIVPGKPAAEERNDLATRLGYTDELLLMTEVYSLWAIEGDVAVAEKLSFAKADKSVVITKDINLFRELKLRLLNGTHTLSCGVAFLAGIETVKEAMEDELLQDYIANLMENEIAPAIPYKVTEQQTGDFSRQCLDRFRNPFIEHKWISITAQYSSKLKLRVVPVCIQYHQQFNEVPKNIVTGFAAYIYFMKAVKEENGNYFGKLKNDYYPIKDDKAHYFYEKWQEVDPQQLAKAVLMDNGLWGYDLSTINGFAEGVQETLNKIIALGMQTVLKQYQAKKSLV